MESPTKKVMESYMETGIDVLVLRSSHPVGYARSCCGQKMVEKNKAAWMSPLQMFV